MVKKMREESIEYLRNRCWELCHEDVSVPEEIDKWAEKEGFGNEEEGYLVQCNGQYGYLYNEEYWHDEQTDTLAKDFAIEHQLKSGEVLQRLYEIGNQLSSKVEESILVIVGEKTGVMEAHELCIFFPFGVDNPTYKETLNLFMQVGKTVA
ncbi:hypothetical protein CVD28_03235 [Bacillus sp. M6-12]|uniref:hypothetical protein n=1 Tax=Bacillus sp. M6-12 TaxID=2054166 RepID=UPI000C78184C|nr:hypothetical protein [Bacillus sp. M6-12]PLS19443.1 hypothetical protein CVD28_03235 [Bacillus sp. M6-12]